MENLIALRESLRKDTHPCELIEEGDQAENCMDLSPAGLSEIITGSNVQKRKKTSSDKLYCQFCKSTFMRGNKATHERSKRHQTLVGLNKNLIKVLLNQKDYEQQQE